MSVVIDGTNGIGSPDLNITGTSARITGDFSNATLANRAAFQTSTTNGNTIVTAIPNGTGTTSQYNAHNNSDIGNSSFAQALATATEVSFRSTAIGTGTFLPMTFHTGGAETVRIDTLGNVGIGGSTTAYKLYVAGAAAGAAIWTTTQNTNATANSQAGYIGVASGTNNYFTLAQIVGGTTVLANVGAGALVLNTIQAQPVLLYTNNTERLRIDSSGNVLVTNPAGLGYGTGAGGTVTQATSKSTAVTLNKPTGQITMNNAALAAGADAAFIVNNSLVAVIDNIILTGGSLASNYLYRVGNVGAGAFSIFVKNNTAVSLSEALVLNFAIIKGASA